MCPKCSFVLVGAKRVLATLLLGPLVWAGTAQCAGPDSGENHLHYTIPADAVKKSSVTREIVGDGWELITERDEFFLKGIKVGERVLGDGSLRETPYKDGNKHGVSRAWSQGTLVEERPFKDGKLHGVCRQWDLQGRLLGTFWMNMGTGILKQWSEDGTREESYCRDGEIYLVKSCTNGQQMSVETPLRQGKPHGLVRWWWPNGQLHSECHHSGGEKHGPESTWNKDGSLWRELHYEKGKPEGIWKYYYESGKLSFQRPYRHGKLHGTLEAWDKEGHSLGKFQMKNGSGVLWTWDEDGRPAEGYGFPECYLDGEFVDKDYYIQASQRDPTLPKFVRPTGAAAALDTQEARPAHAIEAQAGKIAVEIRAYRQAVHAGDKVEPDRLLREPNTERDVPPRSKAATGLHCRTLANMQESKVASPAEVAPKFVVEAGGAANRGDVAKLKALLGKHPALLHASDTHGNGLLHAAARAGSQESVALLLEKGAEVNARGEEGRTALHEAAINSRAEVLKLLLAKQAAVRVKDDGGMTPLHWAADRGKPEIVGPLLAAGADAYLFDRSGRTAVRIATKHGHREVVELLESPVPDTRADVDDGLQLCLSAQDSALEQNEPISALVEFRYWKHDPARILGSTTTARGKRLLLCADGPGGRQQKEVEIRSLAGLMTQNPDPPSGEWFQLNLGEHLALKQPGLYRVWVEHQVDRNRDVKGWAGSVRSVPMLVEIRARPDNLQWSKAVAGLRGCVRPKWHRSALQVDVRLQNSGSKELVILPFDPGKLNHEREFGAALNFMLHDAAGRLLEAESLDAGTGLERLKFLARHEQPGFPALVLQPEEVYKTTVLVGSARPTAVPPHCLTKLRRFQVQELGAVYDTRRFAEAVEKIIGRPIWNAQLTIPAAKTVPIVAIEQNRPHTSKQED